MTLKSRLTGPKLRSPFIVLFFVVFTVNALVVLWLMSVSAQPLMVHLEQPPTSTPPVICPGDTLTYTFWVEVNHATTIDLSYSVAPLSFSAPASQVNLERIAVDQPITLTLTRQWQVPRSFPDVAMSEAPWQPGAYERRVRVRVTGDREVQDEFAVGFEIGKDCPPQWN